MKNLLKNKYISFSLVLLFIFALPLLVIIAFSEQTYRQTNLIAKAEPSIVTPTWYCAGGVNCIPSTSPVPNTSSPSQPASQEISPVVNLSTDPCANNGGRMSQRDRDDDDDDDDDDDKKEAKKHKSSGSGAIQNLINELLKLLEKLINLLNQLTGSDIAVDITPTDETNQQNEAQPSTTPDQSIDPCLTPAAQTITEPTVAPATVAPTAESQPTQAPQVIPTTAAVIPTLAQILSIVPSQIVPSNTAISNVAPSTNTCGGKYRLTNTLKKNFGDPICDYDKNKLYTLLKQIDSKNASIWFNEVVPCESSYNPNAFAAPVGVQLQLDAAGAWGLFQMGRGKNGPLDHGDVIWTMQASNAVNYNNIKLNGNWRYWACARRHWR